MNGLGNLRSVGIEAAVGVGEDDFPVMFSFLSDGGKYKLSMKAEETFWIYLDSFKPCLTALELDVLVRRD